MKRRPLLSLKNTVCGLAVYPRTMSRWPSSLRADWTDSVEEAET